ncbi:hypothetical protein B0H21DRAFT_821804 [Amylocystis lapponica]|nr:hypothetical protein B0H21DRAFT_821804 [Amylocystis lapponica]
MFSKIVFAAVAAIAAFVQVSAEVHTITFNNACGYGTPILKGQDGSTLSTGGAYTGSGALDGVIAFLQNGNCGGNGEGCTLVEATLSNGYSSADISLISPHSFSVSSGFGYYNGCDNSGADCTYNGCPDAFYQPDDTHVQVGCSANDVRQPCITFCK